MQSPIQTDPLLKYLGSKRWLAKIIAPTLRAFLESTNGTYVETFAGSLALGLAISWPKSFYSDVNADLVNLYRCVAEDPVAVSRVLRDFRASQPLKPDAVAAERYYYAIRAMVWPENRDKLSKFELAAYTIWLNKNCFNGLSRYGQKNGHFNVPWGKRTEVALPTAENVLQVSTALRGARIAQADFERVLKAIWLEEAVRSGDLRHLVVFLDPPYGGRLENEKEVRKGKDAGVFTGYTGAFTWNDQIRLANQAIDLAGRGALVVASNSWTKEVCDLYREGFVLFRVGVQHSVGATGDRRGRRVEMLAVSKNHSVLFSDTFSQNHVDAEQVNVLPVG